MARLSKLLSETEILGTNLPSLDIEAGAIRTNSFEVGEGDVFVCIRGGKFDGHDFICVACERGASVIICEHTTAYLDANPAVNYILVGNARLTDAQMWNALCGRPGDRMILVAVTGTNGKTSTTYFLREIFKAAGYVTGIVGTVKCLVGDRTEILTEAAESHVNSMTTPSPERLYPELAHMADEGVEIVFLEASSHSLAQYRLDPLHFAVGIYTNLTPDHLDYHGTMADYFAAKKRLLGLCGVAVVNADDAYFATLPGNAKLPIVTYSACQSPACRKKKQRCDEEPDTNGINAETGITAENGINAENGITAETGDTDAGDTAVGDTAAGETAIGEAADYIAKNPRCRLGDGGIAYDLLERGGLYRILCPVSGDFTVYNTLAAISTARLFGIKPDVIAQALADCPQIPGRMERLPVPENRDIEVYIDYAHTPDALEKVLGTLAARRRPEGRLVVLFGCGGDRDKTKRPVMGRTATEIADFTIITGDNSRTENPRTIICDIMRGVNKDAAYKVIEHRRDAILYAIQTSRPGDIILLAGKGHEDYEIDADGKHPFSERDIVAKALETE